MTGLIVHEWIEKRGGSENVVDSMVTAFPDSDILCLWNNAPARFPDNRVIESWIARTPLRRSKAIALPFMPATWSAAKVLDYDWVLASSHAFAHHVGGRLPDDGPRKFVYVHTPARYVWTPELDERGQHPLARAMAPALKSIDKKRAADGATFAANSNFVRERIRQTWDQDAIVLYPPVRVEHLQSVERWADVLTGDDAMILESLPLGFILGASRFVSYKRLDVVIAAGEAAGLPVVLAGSGPQIAELRARAATATVPVHIVERPSDELLFALYQEAVLFVFPAIEDFGIMPVEAMSLGTPALVYREGGARESVDALGGGAILDDFGSAALRRGVDEAIARTSELARSTSSVNAVFGLGAFESALVQWVGAPRPVVSR